MSEAIAPLVSAAWLAERLNDPSIRILDASWFLPNSGETGTGVYRAGHIPGAVYFDIDQIADRSSNLPHMVPTAEQFAHDVAALGISNNHTVIVYDSGNWMAAPRVWWMFRLFGHDQVAVLDGGLKAWQAAGGEITSVVQHPPRSFYISGFRPELLVKVDEMKIIIDTATKNIVDTRSPERFQGREPEPRPGVRPGHIPTATCVHYRTLIRDDGLMNPPDQLEQTFRAAGIDPSTPIVTSCGSGVSAAVATLALAMLERFDVPLYDGSWSEWGSRNDLPVAQ